MKNVLLYGAGLNCENFINNACMEGINIVGIVDKNKAGMSLCGITIRDIDSISMFEYDYIFVTPMKNDAIIEYLENSLGVEKDKIVKPEIINEKYMIPQLERVSGKVVFITAKNSTESCFGYVFRDNDLFSIVGFLECETKHQVSQVVSLADIELVVLLSDDVVSFEKNGLMNAFRNAYPGAKFLVWMCNPCDNPKYGVPELMSFYGDIRGVKKEFDYIYTYHMGDAEKYGLVYYPQFYPVIKEEDQNEKLEYDVFFIGNAKDRLDMLYRTYERVVSSGLTCRFYITNVDNERRIESDGLIYPKAYIGYRDMLKLLRKSRCILEICDIGDETSFRYAEAIMYNKKLLLNDESVKKRPYYTSDNMYIFDDVERIDVDWVKEPIVEYKYNGELDTEYCLKRLFYKV